MNGKPENQRLLGKKLIFQVEKNRIFETRLIAQGFAKIPSIDHQDNFSPVIYETTFRIVLIMWTM